MHPTRRNLLTSGLITAVVARKLQAAYWAPKVGILGKYAEANLAFAQQSGCTSIGLWANPGTRLDADKVSDAELSAMRDRLRASGLYLSNVGSIVNHTAPEPAARAQYIEYFKKVIVIAGKLGAPFVGTGSGNMPGRALRDQVNEIVRVYTESYFPLCQQHKVRILWEPWPGGPNIATGPVGYDALFSAFGDSPYIGLQYDPSHLLWQMMDPLQTARDFAGKIYDVHIKDTEIRWNVLKRVGIHPVNGEQWWRYRLPGFGSINWPDFFTILMDAGYQGAMNIEHEDSLYGWPYNTDEFSEPYKEGFRVGLRYLRQYLPPSALRTAS